MTFILPAASASRSCLGASWQATWHALVSGKTGFSQPQAQFPHWPPGPPAGIIEAWPDGAPAPFDRFRSIISSVLQDIAPSVFCLNELNPGARCIVIVASSHGDPGPLGVLANPTAARIPGDVIDRLLWDDLTELVAEYLGYVRLIPVHGACASGIVGLLEAKSVLDSGLFDVAVLLAADSISLLAYTGFQNIGAMSKVGCRPFSGAEEGMTTGEGAVALLLAGPNCRLPPGPRVQVLGGACTCDGEGMVEPSTSGLVATIGTALASAQVSPAQVEFVYWHGTGTARNDMTEASTARAIWPDGNVPTGTASKGLLGHTMGAAAGFSVASAAETLVSGTLPGIPYRIDEKFADLNLAATNRHGQFTRGMCVAMGFGGINAAILLENLDK
ncbi:hypothetical protein OICFNHDK_2800 [Methylobacterium bullatum]|uniref:Ketosynthase family 3 (KS3) domain-containing protein n=1 Tax=Methylobacterium bullatum TaxID=570505 RepID=A0AAV4Z928_9HYPH|nr:hypothetical protein OICFNHDK_2800 [Methylobacterium bullatum]